MPCAEQAVSQATDPSVHTLGREWPVRLRVTARGGAGGCTGGEELALADASGDGAGDGEDWAGPGEDGPVDAEEAGDGARPGDGGEAGRPGDGGGSRPGDKGEAGRPEGDAGEAARAGVDGLAGAASRAWGCMGLGPTGAA